MNSFRITLLVLLTLAVVALLCMVTLFQDSQKEAYDAYLATIKANERQQMIAEHQDKMERIGVQEETPDEALEQARRKQEEVLMQQEERNVLASAERKNNIKEEEQIAAENKEEKPLGLVASYNGEWGFIMIRPVSDAPMPKGMVVALRRGDRIVCEAEVGEPDSEGQLSATVRQVTFKEELPGMTPEQFIPAVGDEVIVTPYMSGRELRSAGAGNSFIPSSVPTDATIPEPEGIQEVDAALVPMP